MEGIRILRRAITAGVLAAALAVPGAARAGSLDIGSSMSGYCIGSDCSLVRFTINPSSANAWMDRVIIRNQNPARWWVASLWGANNAQGVDLGWSSDRVGNDFLVRSPGPIGAGTVHLTVQMERWGDYPFSNFSFEGEGHPLGSTVTPEPASMILLGTGLAGIVGAARRRRVRRLSEV